MMDDRHALSCAFLAKTAWAKAQRAPLAGDASNRRYERLKLAGQPDAVLMDAPPQKGEDVRPFVRIAQHLSGLGLSAPKIYEADPDSGFLLIEDLGDDLFARVLQDAPDRERELYEAAAAALIAAQPDPPPGLAHYGIDAMTETAMLLTDWYLPHATGSQLSPDTRKQFGALVGDMLSAHTEGPKVLVQRDYHAENLLWLPERHGTARVGLLDFQDAMIGHPAYDLASLLKDARRDVSPDVQSTTLEFYVAQTGYDRSEFETAYSACSAQRNMRILGVFARLCVRDGKPNYPDLMPRVWRNLKDDLAHPALAELADWVDANVPPPTPELIGRIKDAANG